MKYIMIIFFFIPSALTAMESANTRNPTLRSILKNAPEIRATASFSAHSDPDRKEQKEFSRYLRPLSLECDANGNVTEVDSFYISIKTNKHAPMFQVTTKLLAINELLNIMKVECKVESEHDRILSSTLTMLLPLDTECADNIPLIITDETGKPVILSIQTKPKVEDMPNNLKKE